MPLFFKAERCLVTVPSSREHSVLDFLSYELYSCVIILAERRKSYGVTLYRLQSYDSLKLWHISGESLFLKKFTQMVVFYFLDRLVFIACEKVIAIFIKSSVLFSFCRFGSQNKAEELVPSVLERIAGECFVRNLLLSCLSIIFRTVKLQVPAFTGRALYLLMILCLCQINQSDP